jgi:hypothetical protein
VALFRNFSSLAKCPSVVTVRPFVHGNVIQRAFHPWDDSSKGRDIQKGIYQTRTHSIIIQGNLVGTRWSGTNCSWQRVTGMSKRGGGRSIPAGRKNLETSCIYLRIFKCLSFWPQSMLFLFHGLVQLYLCILVCMIFKYTYYSIGL